MKPPDLLNCYRAFKFYLYGLSCVCAAVILWFVAGYNGVSTAQFAFYAGIFFLPVIILSYTFCRIHLKRLATAKAAFEKANKVNLSVIEVLAASIDAREQMSPEHIQRVQFFSVGLARAMNLSSEHIKALETAALLHGIGKLAVPDYILNKPTRLTLPEMEKVKIHTRVGAEIVKKIGFPYPVTEVIQYFHEHWNGGGYPEGLSGEEIPITARILAIADVYDTIRENRPFRPAKSREEARRLLLSGAGTHFDPKIVDIFLRHLNKFETEIEAKFISTQKSLAENSEVHISQLAANAAPQYLEQIKQANREVFALYELAKLSSASLTLDELLKFLVEQVGDLVPCETVVIYLLDENKKTASVAMISGKNEASLKKMKVKVGEGVTGFVLKNESLVSSVSPALDFTAEFVETAQNYSTMAALPLMTGGRLIGALSIYSETLTGYDEDHLRLLETASNIIADSIWRTIQHAASENRALTDPLTGLPNARGLNIQFNKEVARSHRSNKSFQMIMFDLDDFKKVNDTFGHKVGDILLQEISQLMKMQLRELDFLARYAGDEFVAILPEISGDSLRELCERIKKAVLDYSLRVSETSAATVGISIGIGNYPVHGETLDKVLVAADRNMYVDKAERKQKYNLKLDEENILTLESQTI